MPKLPRAQQEYTVSCRQKYSIRFIDELDNIIKTKDDKLKDLKSTLIISILLCENNTIRIVQPLFLSSLNPPLFHNLSDLSKRSKRQM